MSKLKPYLITAAVVVVVLAVLYRVAPASVRQAIVGS